jgi:hypothetical protein
LLFRYSLRKKSQALRWGNLAGHAIVPLREITRTGNVFEDSRCIPHSVSHCPALLKPESVGFNTKCLQLRFQKCVKHLSVVG